MSEFFYLRNDIYCVSPDGQVNPHETAWETFTIHQFENAVRWCVERGCENESELRATGSAQTGNQLFMVCLWARDDDIVPYDTGSQNHVEDALHRLAAYPDHYC